MRDELQKRYREILLNQVEHGLDVLESLQVGDENYQQVVVNINNASNIAFQLGLEIEKRLKEASEGVEEDAVDLETSE